MSTTYRITNDPRIFHTLASAKRALLKETRENLHTQRLLGKSAETPNWCVFDENENILIWADDLINAE